MESSLVNISAEYGDSCFLSQTGYFFEDADCKKEIPITRSRNNEYLFCEDGRVNVISIYLRYLFNKPGDPQPLDPSWKKREFVKVDPDLPWNTRKKLFAWVPIKQKNPLEFLNGTSHRSDSKTKLKYISKEGSNYRLRIKKLKYSCPFATLEAAVKKRSELLSE